MQQNKFQDYYFWTTYIGLSAFVYINAFLQILLEDDVLSRLFRPSSIAETSSTMACLSSWIVTIRLLKYMVTQETS